MSAIQTLVILLIEKSATGQEQRKIGRKRKEKELITIYTMKHNTDNRDDDEVGETANKLAWLEEKLAGTTDKEERKAIEASILLAQTAHKQALIKGAANSRRAKANDDDGDTDMISNRVAEVVILDGDDDSDHDMSTDNNKRRNGDETEMTDKEKKSKADQEGWAISPKGGCNGNG